MPFRILSRLWIKEADHALVTKQVAFEVVFGEKTAVDHRQAAVIEGFIMDLAGQFGLAGARLAVNDHRQSDRQ